MRIFLLIITMFLPFYSNADLFTNSSPDEFKYLNNHSGVSVFTMLDSKKYPCIYYKVDSGDLQSICTSGGEPVWQFNNERLHILDLAIVRSGSGFFYKLDTPWSKLFCYYRIKNKENLCYLTQDELMNTLYPPIEEDEDLP